MQLPAIRHCYINKRAAEQRCIALLQSTNSLSNLTQIHAFILKLGLHNNPLVLTKFTSTSSDLRATDYASSLLFSPESDTCLYDSFLFNTIIRAYSQTNNSKFKALAMFKLMLQSDVLPNKFTFPFALKACAGIGDLNLGKSIHGSALKFGFNDDVHVQNTMVHMYFCEIDGVEYARKVFDEMSKWDSVSWSAMIGGLTRMGLSGEAIDVFRQMQIAGVCPDEITMVSVLSACTDLGALELGKWAESYIEKEQIFKSVELCNALITMFAKCGDVDRAIELFKNMDEKNIVSWTSLIVGLAMHGRGLEAVELFEKMIKTGINPDNVSFIGLLSACSHSGLVNKGKHYFDLMRKQFGIVPKIEHYGCMVDMLCRVGLIKDAIEFVQKMPIEPNPVILRTLTNACRANGEFKLGESMSRRLIGAEPMQESNYVLLSNIYAKMQRWENKTSIREVMNKKGIKKVPGSTMIELGGKIYEFVAGDKSHSQHGKIYKMVDEMKRAIKRAGYVPVTSEVLIDVDEEEKENNLSTHSEKLAIAFALLKTSPGSPIKIVKNLRVCGDCHSAIKYVSRIYKREIVMRDKNRFHHFKDGLCSCKDFW